MQNRRTIMTYRRPPLFFLGASIGAGSGLICLTGGGSCSLSSFCSISALSSSPYEPSAASWELSTREARLHLAATRRAALRFRSCSKTEQSNHRSTRQKCTLGLLSLYPSTLRDNSLRSMYPYKVP